MPIELDLGDSIVKVDGIDDNGTKSAGSDADTTNLGGSADTTDINANAGQQNSNSATQAQTTKDTDGNQPQTQTQTTTDNSDSNKGEGDKGKSTDAANSSTGELTEGTQIEFDGATYTVAGNGDIVDKDGKVFKQASEVKGWLDSMNVDDGTTNTDNNEITLENIQNMMGVTLEDENGKPAEFSNDLNGIKAYIDAVVELQSKNNATASINRLFADKPYLKEVDDYYIANGGSLDGFGQLPDRSGIKLNKDNEQQLEYVIRAAAHEFGNKSLDDKYIKYLKDTGSLYDVANEQLAALVEKDKATREAYAEKAALVKQQEEKETLEYWNTVKDTITKGEIGGYKIPESFVKDVDGKKITYSRKDFYDYLSKPIKDADGNVTTAYQKDLSNLSKEAYLNQELLEAWLSFTGGSYKDLVNMAVKQEQVKTLRIKAKQNKATGVVKVMPKAKDTAFDLNGIILS